MNRAHARAVESIAPRRAARWRRRALLVALLVGVAVAAAVVWLKVATAISNPEPVSIPKRPRVAALVWSNRVFLDEAAFKLWLDGHGTSYAVWVHNHPHAVATLAPRPRSRR